MEVEDHGCSHLSCRASSLLFVVIVYCISCLLFTNVISIFHLFEKIVGSLSFRFLSNLDFCHFVGIVLFVIYAFSLII